MNYRRAMIMLSLALWSMPVYETAALSVHVQDAPIRSVLEGLARSENLNLVLDDTVQGTMTMHLTDVTASEAIEAIAASQNLFYDKSRSVRTITAGCKR